MVNTKAANRLEVLIEQRMKMLGHSENEALNWLTEEVEVDKSALENTRNEKFSQLDDHIRIRIGALLNLGVEDVDQYESTENSSKPKQKLFQYVSIPWLKVLLKAGSGLTKSYSGDPTGAFEVADSALDGFRLFRESPDTPKDLLTHLISGACARTITTIALEEEQLREPFAGASKRDLIRKTLREYEGSGLEIDEAIFHNPAKSRICKQLESLIQAALSTLVESENLDRAVQTEVRQRIMNRIPEKFALSLRAERRSNPRKYNELDMIERISGNDFMPGVRAQVAWNIIRARVQQEVHRPLLNRPFSLKEMFVDLRAYRQFEISATLASSKIMIPRDSEGNSIEVTSLSRNDAEKARKAYRERVQELGDAATRNHQRDKYRLRYVRDAKSQLLDWFKKLDKQDALRVIAGGPGSGKSSLAKIFAAEIAKEYPAIDVLFVQLHKLPQGKDMLQDRIEAYFHDKLSLSNRGKIFLVLDGLDEIGMRGQSTMAEAEKLVYQINALIRSYNENYDQHLRVLLCGRSVIVDGCSDILHRRDIVLHLLSHRPAPEILGVEQKGHSQTSGRVVWVDDDRAQHRGNEDSPWRGLESLAFDRRHLIWESFYKKQPRLEAVAFATLKNHDRLEDASAQPLLLVLILLTLRKDPTLLDTPDNMASISRNKIYYELFSQVLADVNRQKELESTQNAANEERNSPVSKLSPSEYAPLFEKIALLAWHSGEVRSVASHQILDEMKEISKNTNSELLRRVCADARGGAYSLLVAFYFRETEIDAKTAFEFTHKSFGEYFAARAIVAFVSNLIGNGIAELDAPRKRGKLYAWAMVFGPAEISETLHDFILEELSSFVAQQDENMQRAKKWKGALESLLQQAIAEELPVDLLPMPTEKLHQYHLVSTLDIEDAASQEPVSKRSYFQELQRWWRNASEALLVVASGVTQAINERNYRDANAPVGVKRILVRPVAQDAGPAVFRAWFHRIIPQNYDQNEQYIPAINALSALDLTSADARSNDDINTARSDLRRTHLATANLSYSDLSHSNLTHADLSDTNLVRSILVRADLSFSDLSYADLSHANLSNANLSQADLSNANLSDSNLFDADLTQSDLSGAKLLRADLRRAVLYDALIDYANLSDADLRAARGISRERALKHNAFNVDEAIWTDDDYRRIRDEEPEELLDDVETDD